MRELLHAMCGEVVSTADALAAEPHALDDLDLDGAVLLLADVADAVDALTKSIRPALERAALRLLDGKEHEVDGITVTKRTARTEEVWDNQAILGQVVVHAVASREVNDDGEIADPAWAAAQALDRIYGLTGRKSTKPKTTELQKFLGWDKEELDEYRQFAGWKPPTLQLTRPKAGA